MGPARMQQIPRWHCIWGILVKRTWGRRVEKLKESVDQRGIAPVFWLRIKDSGIEPGCSWGG